MLMESKNRVISTKRLHGILLLYYEYCHHFRKLPYSFAVGNPLPLLFLPLSFLQVFFFFAWMEWTGIPEMSFLFYYRTVGIQSYLTLILIGEQQL